MVTIGYRVTFHNVDPLVAKNVNNDNAGIWRSRLCLGFRSENLTILAYINLMNVVM